MEEHMQPTVLALSDATRDTLAGAISGICGVIVGQPLDVIRVRQQQRQSSATARATHLFSVFSSEGGRALFRGMAYPLSTTAFQNALVFQSYGAASRYLHMGDGVNSGADGTESGGSTGTESGGSTGTESGGSTGTESGGSTGTEPGAPSPSPALVQVAAAGGWTGLVQTSIITPVELLKIRLQLQTTSKGQPGHLGSLDMLARVLRTEGIQGLYRGTVMTAARDVPSFASYFAAFEATRRTFDPEGCSGAAEPRLVVILAAGAAAGVAAWAMVYPLDLVKSRLQARPGPGSWEIARDIAARDGWRGFFKGFAPTMARALLVNAAIFSSFEACHAWLRGLDTAKGIDQALAP